MRVARGCSLASSAASRAVEAEEDLARTGYDDTEGRLVSQARVADRARGWPIPIIRSCRRRRGAHPDTIVRSSREEKMHAIALEGAADAS